MDTCGSLNPMNSLVQVSMLDTILWLNLHTQILGLGLSLGLGLVLSLGSGLGLGLG